MKWLSRFGYGILAEVTEPVCHADGRDVSAQPSVRSGEGNEGYMLKTEYPGIWLYPRRQG